MTSERAPVPGRFENPREDPRFADAFRRSLEELKTNGFLDPDEILAAHPDFGPAILEDLETYIQLAPENETNPDESPAMGTLGDYTLRRRIGRGGMGVVYEAWENSMDRPVALKVLPNGIAADDKAFQRFCREAKLAGKLSHPSIVPVYGMGIKEDTPHYAMEYVEGETLAQVISEFKNDEPDLETPFGPRGRQDFVIRLGAAFADVADGLQHAHSKGVVHRDIKPSNLILDRDGHLRILDFGLARLDGQVSLTVSGDLMGTVLYMSPEQAMAKRIPLDHRTDVYSLGATVYETLTGEPPFRGKNQQDTLSQIIVRDPRPPRQLNPGVPKDLETIVLKCLRKDAGDRYGTAEALAQDLRRFVRGDAIEARPLSGWERLATRLKSHRTRLLVASGFVILLAALAWLAYLKDHADDMRLQAEHRQKVDAYEPSVRAALRKFYAGRFSLDVLAGQTAGLFPFAEDALSPVGPQDFRRQHAYGRELSSVEAAADELKTLATTLKENRDAHYHLARACVVLGRVEEARGALARALGCDPDFVPARALLLELSEQSPADLRAQSRGWQQEWLAAVSSARRGKWRQAAEAYTGLLTRREREEPYIGCFTEAYLGRGVARLMSQLDPRPFEAQQDFLRAEERGAGIESRLLLAKACYLNDQRDEAEGILTDLHSRIGPAEKYELILWIAGIYNSLRDYSKGLAWAEKLGEELPIRDRLRGCFLLRLGRTSDAKRAVRRALARNGRDARAHLVLATALLKDVWTRARGPSRKWRLVELLGVSRTAADLAPEDVVAQGLLTTAQQEVNQEVLRFLRRMTLKSRGPAHGLWAGTLALCANRTTQTRKGFFEGVESIDAGLRGAKCFLTTSADERVLYFTRFDDGNPRNNPDIYFMTRERREDPFVGPARPLDELNTPYEDWVAPGSLSGDETKIYFASNRPGDAGWMDVWKARFNVPGDPAQGFHDIRPLGGVNTPGREAFSTISRDGQRLYFRSNRRSEIYVAFRGGTEHEERFGDPVLLSSRLGGPWVLGPTLSRDELTMIWCEVEPFRATGYGANDIWMATRETIVDENGAPVPFDHVVNPGPPLSTASMDFSPHLTAAWPGPGSGVYFARFFAPDDSEIYRATWHPDCNENHLDDLEEIDAGFAEDADADGIPDECDR